MINSIYLEYVYIIIVIDQRPPVPEISKILLKQKHQKFGDGTIANSFGWERSSSSSSSDNVFTQKQEDFSAGKVRRRRLAAIEKSCFFGAIKDKN